MNGIYWSRIVAAAARRLVAMPGELAGYLVLGALDAMGARPGRLVAGDIQLTDGGRVALLRVLPSDAAASDRCLRELLRQLLDVSSSPSPALLRVACSSTQGAGATFATELHTALIPVNRAAARRALSRLHRELLRLGPSVVEPLEATAQAEEEVRALGTCVDDEAEAQAALVVEELERDVPVVVGIELSDPNAAEAIAVSPQVPAVGHCLSEIPDLELPLSSRVSKEQELCECSREEATEGTREIEVRAETLLIASVAAVAPSVACDSPIAREDSEVESAGMTTHPAGRETTLMIAPVVQAPRLEQTQRLNVEASAVPIGVASAAPVVTEEAQCALEPTMALPLVTLRHRVQDQTVERIVPDECIECSSCEAPALAEAKACDNPAEPPSCDAPVLAEANADEKPAEPSSDDGETRDLTDVEANVVASCWDATSMDTVVEVSDDEIIYEQGADEASWLDIDCSDDGLFEAVPPRVAVLRAAPFVDHTVCGESEEVLVVENVAFGTAAADGSDGSSDDDGWEVDDGDLLVVEGECDLVSGCDLEESRGAEDNPASPLGVRLEPTTHYRNDSLGSDGPRSTVEGLSKQFVAEPTWSEDELCRNLRFVAGFDLSSSATSVSTHTPPPTVETILNENPEQAEPTRRLRRVGSMVAVVLLMGAGAYGVRSAEGKVASASQLSVDALGQICRATVTVAGVEARQHVRIRQVGDLQLRAPTSVSNATASFVGLRCGEDAELFVQELPAAALRRIPISGDRLLPRDTHPLASVAFHLDGQGFGG